MCQRTWALAWLRSKVNPVPPNKRWLRPHKEQEKRVCAESPPGDRGQGDGASSLRGWGAGGCSGPPRPFLTSDWPRSGVRPPSPPAAPDAVCKPPVPQFSPDLPECARDAPLGCPKASETKPPVPCTPGPRQGSQTGHWEHLPSEGCPLWGTPTTDKPRCLFKLTASRQLNGSSLSVPTPLTPRVAPSP